MANFVDPSDQSLWPDITGEQTKTGNIDKNNNNEVLSYQNYREKMLNKNDNIVNNNNNDQDNAVMDDYKHFVSRYTNARGNNNGRGYNNNNDNNNNADTVSEISTQPYNVQSDTISHDDSHLNDHAYIDNDRRLQKMRNHDDHRHDRRNRRGSHMLYASTMHSNITHKGKNTIWNTAKQKRQENLSYYEKIRKEVERNSVNSYNEESQVISNWHHVLKANTLTVAKNARLRDEVMPKIKRVKPQLEGTNNLYIDRKKHKSEFHLRNKDQGYDVIANGGAPISEGAKSMHRARLLDAAERDDQRYWNSHSYHAFRGKNNVWNIQQPKFEDSIRTRKGRNPTPTRIQQQFKMLAKTKTIFED